MALSEKPSFVNVEKVETIMEWLASFGKTENKGVTRLLYSQDWMAAQQALKEKMVSAGLTSYFDDIGNLFGRMEGSDPKASVILTGSHVDTVVDGGKYDGAYGVIASLIAVQRLKQKYGSPLKSIEVVSLCEEEGSRFPITFWGSGNITGKYSNREIHGLEDSDGVSFKEAMESLGFGQGKYRNPNRDDIGCFIELHVEQGSVLETEGKSLGVVTHIVGQRRFNVQIVGESNHAGTTPMSYRKDAMSSASELISYVTKKARQIDQHLVATVGKISAKPNVPNVVAGEVTFTLDIRHHEEQTLDAFCNDIFQYFQTIAAHNKVEVTHTEWMNVKPVEMDRELIEISSDISDSQKIPFKEMLSGAGHDAQVFGTYCPTSLLFVPSCNGISHSPKEFTNLNDLENGIDILAELLYKLAY